MVFLAGLSALILWRYCPNEINRLDGCTLDRYKSFYAADLVDACASVTRGKGVEKVQALQK